MHLSDDLWESVSQHIYHGAQRSRHGPALVFIIVLVVTWECAIVCGDEVFLSVQVFLFLPCAMELLSTTDH